jgi:hypothetical protein
MIDLTKVPPGVLEANRQRDGLEPHDTSRDTFYARRSGRQLFRAYCLWHGLIDWEGTLWAVVEGLQKAER